MRDDGLLWIGLAIVGVGCVAFVKRKEPAAPVYAPLPGETVPFRPIPPVRAGIPTTPNFPTVVPDIWPWAPASEKMLMQRGQGYEMRSTVPLERLGPGFVESMTRAALPVAILGSAGGIVRYTWTAPTDLRAFPFWFWGQREIRPASRAA